MIWTYEYDCIWTAKAKYIKDGEVKKEEVFSLKSRPCFGDILSNIRRYHSADVSYKVYFRSEDYDHAQRNLLNLSNTRKVLRYIQRVIPFSYKLGVAMWRKSNWTDAKAKCNVLLVHLEGPILHHLFVTTMLRTLFEYPYNVAAYDAFRAIKEGKEFNGVNFKELSWLDLYFIIISVMNGTTGHGLCDLGHNPKLHNYKELRKLIDTSKHYYCWESICDGKSIRNHIPYIIKLKNYKDLRSQEEFDKRCSIYAQIYKVKKKWK